MMKYIVGAKINQCLAKIASKWWGIAHPNDKLKPLLAKHAKPENCPDITTVRVNPEFWDQMNNFRPLCQEQIKPALKAEFHSLCTQANELGNRSDLLFGADLGKQLRDAKDTNKIGKDIGLGKTGASCSSCPYNSHRDKRRHQKNYGKHYRPAESKPPFLGKGQIHLLQEPNREDIIQSLENIKKTVSEFPSLVRALKEYLDNTCTYFQAGCITKSISNWQMITSDKEILTSVRGATNSIIEFDTRITQRPQSAFSVKESAIFDSEVSKLLSKNVIETTDHAPYDMR